MSKNKYVASSMAKLTVDVKRARKYDIFFRMYRELARKLVIAALVFLALGACLICLGLYISGGIPVLLGLVCLNYAVRKGSGSKKALTEIYTEGLLIPAIIRRTDPLTVIALAPLLAGEGVARYGCREFEVKELPGHALRRNERVPCTSMYAESQNPNYHSHFEIHPICWATDNAAEIQDNIYRIRKPDEREYASELPDEWAILDELAEKLPFNNTGVLYILDEKYQPLISRNYDGGSSMEYLLTREKIKENFQKRYDGLQKLSMDNWDNRNTEKLVKLAYEHQVAEYFLGFDGERFRSYITPFNNPAAADKVISALRPALQAGETPLVVSTSTRSKAVVTNKGVWNKGGFTPWRNVPVYIYLSSDRSSFETELGQWSIAPVRACYDLYTVDKEQIDKLKTLLNALEVERLTAFWLAVKREFS
jgi:hypothetical protein